MEEQFVVLDSSYLPEMASLYKKAFGREPWNDDWSDIDQLTEYIKEISSGYHPLNYGLLRDGKLCAVSIGQVKHWWQGTEYYLDELFVDPEYQGRGVGSRFLQMIEEDIKKRGISGIFLQTDNDKPAYGFYQRRSFKELTEHVSFFKEINSLNITDDDEAIDDGSKKIINS